MSRVKSEKPEIDRVERVRGIHLAKKLDTAVKPHSGSTVTVGCKLPNGMLLQLAKPTDIDVPVLGGGMRTETQWRFFGPQVKINGSRLPFGIMPAFPIVGGFALTEGVPEDFWDAWFDQHKEDPSVVNGLIFAHDKTVDATANAKEYSSLRSGLEGLDVSDNGKGFMSDPRVPDPRKTGVNIAEMSTAKREAA